MRTCYHCGKPIKKQAVLVIPPKLHISLGIDTEKAYHPKCYEIAEPEAAKELRR